MKPAARSQQPATNRIIRASDLAQYSYCARAWWLGSVMGAPSVNVREMQQGEAAHQQHGRQVWWSSALIVLAVVLILAAVALVIASL
jgi:hypothetical protein